jgi:hypothetical protein
MRGGALLQCGKGGVRHYVLCASFAPDYATKRDDFSAVVLLLGREKTTGGKVDEGYRGASGAEDGAGRARRGGMAEDGGQWGKGAGRGRMGRGGATHTALWEGMGAGDGRGSYARGPRGQGAGYALLSYPTGGEGGRGIEGHDASGFGLRSPAVRP